MVTQGRGHVITGPRAAELAGITYRQLDYWARQGWLEPSVVRGRGRSARREYSRDDVVRLAALAHLGRTKADVSTLGPTLGRLEIPEHDFLIVVGAGLDVRTVPASAVRSAVSSGEPVRVFDPLPLRRRLKMVEADEESVARRTA